MRSTSCSDVLSVPFWTLFVKEKRKTGLFFGDRQTLRRRERLTIPAREDKIGKNVGGLTAGRDKVVWK
jgi:hypothetical protein